MSRVSRTVLVSTAVLLLWASPSLAASSPVISDCSAHGQLTRQYSLQQLQGALTTMPPDVREYTNCVDVIQRQLQNELGAVHPGAAGSSKGSGGSFLPTPVIIVLAVLVLGAAVFAGLAVRRRGGGGPPTTG
jgi:hypothetical protein